MQNYILLSGINGAFVKVVINLNQSLLYFYTFGLISYIKPSQYLFLHLSHCTMHTSQQWWVLFGLRFCPQKPNIILLYYCKKMLYLYTPSDFTIQLQSNNLTRWHKLVNCQRIHWKCWKIWMQRFLDRPEKGHHRTPRTKQLLTPGDNADIKIQ